MGIFKSDLDKQVAAAQKRVAAAEQAVKDAGATLQDAKVEHAAAMAKVLAIRTQLRDLDAESARAAEVKARAARMAQLRKQAAQPFDEQLRKLKGDLATVAALNPQALDQAVSRIAALERSKEITLAKFATT